MTAIFQLACSRNYLLHCNDNLDCRIIGHI